MTMTGDFPVENQMTGDGWDHPVQPPTPPRDYDLAVNAVDVALTAVTARLTRLREERQTINDEIRLLVDEQNLLGRAARLIANRTEGDGEG